MNDDIHVTPEWQEHETSPSCWCQPIYEDQPLGGRVWLHRAAHDDPHRYTEANDPALRRPSEEPNER